ncbi:MAG: class I SAM-dependent methyltransferase, partial [Candidatus Absconditabacterales bacterium]
KAEGGKLKAMCVLDLGCGCGVLGLSVASELSEDYDNLNLQSRDISADAVALTQQNIQTYQALLPQVRMTTCVSEGLKQLQYQPTLLEQWQMNPLVIVCNYPYIPDETFEINADECAKTREPRSAFVGGEDGLDLYRVLFGEIEQYGLRHAVLFLEMMTWQMDKLIQEFGDHVDLQIIKTFHFNIIIVKAQWKH